MIERDPIAAARSAHALAGPAVLRGLAFAAVLSLLCNVGVLAVPLFNMQIFNRVLTTGNRATLAALVCGVAIAVVAYGALDRLRSEAVATLGDRLVRRLSLPLLRAAALSRDGAPGEALRDLETLRAFFASPVCLAPFEMMWSPVLLLVLLALHWGYAALALAGVVLLAGLNALGDALSRRQMLAANEASAQELRTVVAAMRGAEAVLAMGMLPTLAARWDRAQAVALAGVRGALGRARGVASATRALRLGLTGAMVALGLVLAIGGAASSGSMVAGNMLMARLLQPFEQLAATRRQWVAALAAWRRIRATLNAAVPARYTTPLPRPIGHLSVERLVHLLPGADRPVLRGVSFEVRPGETLGVIGPSGAGKSSLLRLLLGMVEPASGGVYLDGHNTFLWERADLARHVGYVPQSAVLADVTVAENIARLQLPDIARVIAAAKLAGVHDIVASLPLGYATPVRGFTLSAGQRQRIALARALYSEPRLLLLDEPSSFLDEAGEQALVALLRRLQQRGVGAVVVTHRPALIAAVDTLLVLKDGLVDRVGARDAVLRAIAAPRIRLLRAAS